MHKPGAKDPSCLCRPHVVIRVRQALGRAKRCTSFNHLHVCAVSRPSMKQDQKATLTGQARPFPQPCAIPPQDPAKISGRHITTGHTSPMLLLQDFVLRSCPASNVFDFRESLTDSCLHAAGPHSVFSVDMRLNACGSALPVPPGQAPGFPCAGSRADQLCCRHPRHDFRSPSYTQHVPGPEHGSNVFKLPRGSPHPPSLL